MNITKLLWSLKLLLQKHFYVFIYSLYVIDLLAHRQQNFEETFSGFVVQWYSARIMSLVTTQVNQKVDRNSFEWSIVDSD